jgi:cephalosporin hydroxylase
MSIEDNNAESWEWHTTFVGLHMAHNYRLYYIIDSLFRDNTFHSIVEIGTGHGSLTLVLGLWGLKLGIPVTSLDIDGTHYNKTLFDALKINFINEDEFSESAKEQIVDALGRKPALLICDGGLKRWEFNMFAPLTSEGSIIGVHDWGNECTYEDIEDTVAEYCSIYQEQRWNEMNVQFATFMRK